MAVKMMIGLLSVICIINFILMNKQTDALADRDMEIKALIEMNQNEIKNLRENQDTFFEQTDTELRSLRIKLSRLQSIHLRPQKKSSDKFESLKILPIAPANG